MTEEFQSSWLGFNSSPAAGSNQGLMSTSITPRLTIAPHNPTTGQRVREVRMETDDSFSCPYRKRDPLKFNIRQFPSCAYSRYRTLSLVKEHLLKHHRIPLNVCSRCYERFWSSEELESHLRVPSDEMCPLKNTKPPDSSDLYMSENVFKDLLLDQDASHLESWQGLWQALFPDARNAPSPNYVPPVAVEIPEIVKTMGDLQLPTIPRRTSSFAQGNLTQSQHLVMNHLLNLLGNVCLEDGIDNPYAFLDGSKVSKSHSWETIVDVLQQNWESTKSEADRWYEAELYSLADSSVISPLGSQVMMDNISVATEVDDESRRHDRSNPGPEKIMQSRRKQDHHLFVCSCSYKTDRKANFRRHLEKCKASTEGKYKCSCDYTCKDRDTLLDHLSHCTFTKVGRPSKNNKTANLLVTDNKENILPKELEEEELILSNIGAWGSGPYTVYDSQRATTPRRIATPLVDEGKSDIILSSHPTVSKHGQLNFTGAWGMEDDKQLIDARRRGLNWVQIQETYFKDKTANSCRKRHERLLERLGSKDADEDKLKHIAKEYSDMRKELWSGLADRTGESWAVVEQKVMSTGLRNLQSLSRAANRSERRNMQSSERDVVMENT